MRQSRPFAWNPSPGSVSCASAVSCSAGGFYDATPAFALGFVVSGALPQTSRSVLRLSAARVTYGYEQSERITVTVSPQRSGRPAGTVTVRAGSATLCAITLRSGKGACSLSARELPVGKYGPTASYAGSTGFSGSVSAVQTITVLK